MKSVSQCLGENLKRLRRERGLTQGAFAQAAGLSMSFLQNLERGKKWVGPKTVNVLARTLRVSEAELFRDCEHQAKAPDPKYILLMMGRALGLELTEEMVGAIEVRATPTPRFMIYELMPDHVCHELAELCRRPGWDWESFRKRLQA